MGWYSPVKRREKERLLKTAFGLGVTCEVKSWLITTGICGVTVNSRVGVTVAVFVTVGVCVIVGVSVMVGVCVMVGEGWKILYVTGSA